MHYYLKCILNIQVDSVIDFVCIYISIRQEIDFCRMSYIFNSINRASRPSQGTVNGGAVFK